MRQTLFYIFGPLAVAGLALSIVTHVAALMGRSGPLGDLSPLLHVGIFIVWIPAVFVSQGLTRQSKRADFWKAALQGAPAWARYATYALFVYAFINFSFSWLSKGPRNGMTATGCHRKPFEGSPVTGWCSMPPHW